MQRHGMTHDTTLPVLTGTVFWGQP